MNKKHLSQLLEDNRVVALLSLLIAIVAWVVVAVVLSPEKTMTISKVPVRVAYNAAAYQSMGLDVVDYQEYTVDISVTGPRSVVGALDGEDFIVYPQTSQVTEPGRYSLPLVVSKVNSLLEFEVNSVTPSTINLWFDQIVTKKFVVETELSGISIAEGFILGQSYTTPAEVTLIGPEQEVSQVARVVATVALTEELEGTIISTEPLLLYNEEGNLLEDTHITVDSPRVEVTVPVMKRAELPLRLGFTNVPAGFNTDTLPYALSVASVNVAGPASVLDDMEYLEIGRIDLQSFSIGESQSFTLQLPAGFVCLDNITEITAVFDSERLGRKTVTVPSSNIELVNVPSDLHITLQTGRISAVRLVGDITQLEGVTADNVTAQVDCSAVTVSRGQQTVAARLLVNGADGVLAVGSYTVVVNVTTSE